MAGYVRQSSGSLVSGLTITAALFNAEFNALRDAFNDTTGHEHDGTTGDAPKISLTGSVTGTLPIASGGTNATTAGAARTSFGLVIGTNVQAWDAQLDTLAAISDVSNLSDIAGLAVTDSLFIVGDGSNYVAESGSTARTSLGLGSIATQNSNAITITGGTITAITDLAVGDGGTGASNAAGARTNLGLAIGSNVQAFDAGLLSIAGLTTLADRMIYTTASDTYAVTTLTSFGRSIIDDANAAAVRTTIGSAIGTDVQAHDAQLDDIAALAVTNSNFIVGNGTNWVAESGSTARTSLGLAIGSNVQAWDANLDQIAALAPTANNFVAGNGSAWVLKTPATARTSLGLTTENIQDNEIAPMFDHLNHSGLTVVYNDASNELELTVPPSGTAVDESDYDAATILVANTNNVPIISTFAVHSMLIRNGTVFANATIGTDEIVGRSGSGDINGLSASTARTVLGLGTAALVDTGTGASDVPTITQADGRYFVDGVGDTLGVGDIHDLGRDSSIHIKSGDSGVVTLELGAEHLVIENNGASGISLLSSTAASSKIAFGDSGNSFAGGLTYSHGSDVLIFRSGGSDNMTLDAGLQMGSPTGGDKGAGSINASALYVDGASVLSAASDTAKGIVELATITETNTGTDNVRAVTPDGLDGWTGSAQIVTVGTLSSGNATAIVSAASASAAGKVELATTAEANTGTDTTRAIVASGLEDTRKRLKGQSTSSGTTDTLVAGDAGTQMIYTAATAVTIDINDDVHTADDVIFITQRGAGQITIAGTLATKNSADNLLSTRTQNSTIGIKFISATEADIFGDLA